MTPKIVVKLTDSLSLVIFCSKVLNTLDSPNYSDTQKFEAVCEYLAENEFYSDDFKVLAASKLKEILNPEIGAI